MKILKKWKGLFDVWDPFTIKWSTNFDYTTVQLRLLIEKYHLEKTKKIMAFKVSDTSIFLKLPVIEQK